MPHDAPAINTHRFPLGRTVTTRGVRDALDPLTIQRLLHRHATGDWGDLCPEDKAANNHGLQDGGRLLSAYQVRPDLKVWVITEADRSGTTVLLPNEY